ncbi:hypothetical protein OG21DRAFT_1466417 [Imleria badia]|nr:hypothetical protein OG21DRAFT_1466417 [Imleria badia]
MAPPPGSSLHELVGPAIPQAFQLARYQALRSISKDVVEEDENDVINHKPTPEEKRVMKSNAAVVSALEDLFSWIHKDQTCRTSQLSYVESWRFHRAMYRVWIMSTLYGYGSATHGQRATGASPDTQRTFLQKFTSQELVHISKVSRFLQGLAGWVILAEPCKLVGSLEVYDFKGLYLFAGPYIILRCYEEQSSDPLPLSYVFDDEVYEKFLLPSVAAILSERNITIPLAFVGSILDEVRGANNTCRACGRDGRASLPAGTQCTPELYNENNWARLKGYMGLPSEIFVKLPSNVVERPLFNTLKEANYDTLFHELFADTDGPSKDWTKEDWICIDCIREFFRMSIFRWWRERKLRAGKSISPDCRHGYCCKDQCYEAGQDHAKRFNVGTTPFFHCFPFAEATNTRKHVCEPVDLQASLAYFHSR